MREVPSYYMDQIQGVMNVMGLDVCDFVQFLPEKNGSKEVLHIVSVCHDDKKYTETWCCSSSCSRFTTTCTSPRCC